MKSNQFNQLITNSFNNNDDSTLELIHTTYLEWCSLNNEVDEFEQGGDFQPEFITSFSL
tara:strand:- start:149 stop:325 length:177 start_codon:yes stop_codon:yes gene_type:complete